MLGAKLIFKNGKPNKAGTETKRERITPSAINKEL